MKPQSNIKEYYSNFFREDIKKFMIDYKDTNLPYFGHGWEYECRELNNVSEENRSLFIICLYFTVLVDQAMHTYYRELYPEFEKLTKYPKFCHGLGQFQKNPRNLLFMPVEKGMVDKNEIVEKLEDAMVLFVNETLDFFRNYLPQVSGKEFFEKLIYDKDVQIPEIFGLLDKNVQNNVDYIAYKALLKVIKQKLM